MDLIRPNFLVKITIGKSFEYFVLNETDKNASESEEFVSYETISLGWELNYKNIRGYEAKSKTLSYLTNDMLVNTGWSLGYVDSEFDLKYRSIEISSQTVLEVLNDLAEKFNSLIVWDTHNKKVEMWNPSNYGKNKGLRVTDEKYLMSFSENQDATNIVTRLKLYGQDNLSIRRINPTGSPYIEDFSYYIYPFERTSGVVTKHSNYMSDSLCNSLLDYNELVTEKKGIFESWLQDKEILEGNMLDELSNLIALETELSEIMDLLDVENSLPTNQKDPVRHADIVINRGIKEQEIESKKSEISVINNNIDSLQVNLNNLQVEIKTENNFTQEQLLNLDPYIKEHVYTNDAIISEEDLLKEGIKEFEELREPIIEVTIDIVNLLEIIEAQNDWDKLELGDIIRVRYERLNMYIKAKITEINYDFDDSTIKVTLSNAKNYKGNSLMNMINQAYGSSTEVNMNKYKWDLAEENNGAINDIINNIWDATKNGIEAGIEQDISINERGIIVRSPDDPNTYLVIQNGMMAITNDNGNTWKHAITSEGIVGERIYGKIIMGVNLAIEDKDGILKFRGSKGQIFDRNGEEVMRLGLITDPPEDDCFGIKLENDRNQVFVSSCDGFKITKKKSGSFEDVMYADLNGNFWVKDFTAKNLTIEDNDGYFKFNGNEAIVSDGTKDVMWLGYLSSESPSDFGVIVESVNSTVYMTRKRGFEITKSGVTKFKADLNGSLYAEDIVAKNLQIVDGNLGEKIIFDQNNGITINGNNGEQIRLNANEGIAIDVNNEPRLWIGADGLIYAKRLIITPENPEELVQLEDGSFISDLTVSSLRSLDSLNIQNYILIEDNYLKILTGRGDVVDQQKFLLTMKDPSGTDWGYPYTEWGYGNGYGNDKGYLWKDSNVFSMDYVDGAGLTQRFRLINTLGTVGDDSVLIEANGGNIHAKSDRKIILKVNASNYIEVSSSGVNIVGSEINLN